MEAVLLLRKNTAVALQQFLAGKMPKVPAFKMPGKYRMADMIRADCEAAGIDYEENGRGKIDFHSLRHTTGNLLAGSGVHQKVTSYNAFWRTLTNRKTLITIAKPWF